MFLPTHHLPLSADPPFYQSPGALILSPILPQTRSPGCSVWMKRNVSLRTAVHCAHTYILVYNTCMIRGSVDYPAQTQQGTASLTKPFQWGGGGGVRGGKVWAQAEYTTPEPLSRLNGSPLHKHNLPNQNLPTNLTGWGHAKTHTFSIRRRQIFYC